MDFLEGVTVVKVGGWGGGVNRSPGEEVGGCLNNWIFCIFDLSFFLFRRRRRRKRRKPRDLKYCLKILLRDTQ